MRRRLAIELEETFNGDRFHGHSMAELPPARNPRFDHRGEPAIETPTSQESDPGARARANLARHAHGGRANFRDALPPRRRCPADGGRGRCVGCPWARSADLE